MLNKVKNFGLHVARVSPLIVIIIPLIAYVITGHKFLLHSGIGIIIGGTIFNYVIKLLLKKYKPNNKDWVRPNPPKYGCGLFIEPSTIQSDDNSNSKIMFGMPSGHSQTLSFATTLAIIYVFIISNQTMINKLLSCLVLIILNGSVMYSRIYEGCHTKQQVLIGSGIGSISAILFYLLYLNHSM